MPSLTITQLTRHEPEGQRPYYTARVHAEGQHLDTANRFGSWHTADGRRELRPEVAAALQAKLPRGERRAAR